MFVVLEAGACGLSERFSVVLGGGLHVAPGFVNVAEPLETIRRVRVVFDEQEGCLLGLVETSGLNEINDGVGLFDEGSLLLVFGPPRFEGIAFALLLCEKFCLLQLLGGLPLGPLGCFVRG